MHALAVVLDAPQRLALRRLELTPPGAQDVVVETHWSGVSAGTERLFWEGRMPSFPGMGYPLVPGYESVGRVIDAGAEQAGRIGELVFAPGAACYRDAKGLFGGAASRLVLKGARAMTIPEGLEAEGALLALAATAYHALAQGPAPELIVGHGALGRLVARITVALGHEAPVVWEARADRRDGAQGCACIAPEDDDRFDYAAICDVSGDAGVLDTLMPRLARGGEITLAGFYAAPLSFAFPPAFLKEARFRVAAEWAPADLTAVTALVAQGRLSLSGLITHTRPASMADAAYADAFGDPACLKMIFDWRGSQ